MIKVLCMKQDDDQVRLQEISMKVRIEDKISKVLQYASVEYGGKKKGGIISTLGKMIEKPD